ncbi:MAG TPA: Clp protease N-terminal domain-containing protein [Acidobacteriaceae bacterium]
MSEKLRQDLAAPARLEPLHLLAAVLSDDSSDVARILTQAGASRDAVIAILRKPNRG